VQLKVAKGDLESDYTAISHVWSGGLGNFKGTGKHRCQLANLLHIIGSPLGSLCRDAIFAISIPSAVSSTIT
jgi:hypothetical protein